MQTPCLFIAGPAGQVQNYLSAFSLLGARCHTLPDDMGGQLPLPGVPSPDADSLSGSGMPADRFALPAFDALVLPGGGDIDPSLFHQQDQGSRSIDPLLDRLQLSLLKVSLKNSLPVLGICKGMQLINIFFGGGICQDLPTRQQHEAAAGHDRIHLTRTQKGSLLHSLYGESFPVNSAHHQGISEPGKDLAVIQRAPDGVAEALVHVRFPVLGVQWHPERMSFSFRQPDMPDGSLLLAHFLSLARRLRSLRPG
ncbi:MAG TPA: gamma-glutamyl-gamma-aminobutyrate hydrolase family protein [Candidatus Eisenbergiella intestinipullorum]|nr:gamma-glutamyl-gamma-aminobutyrate hydrolase family protein [Candidatus Eisenbergiella intestinipullorum]